MASTRLASVASRVRPIVVLVATTPSSSDLLDHREDVLELGVGEVRRDLHEQPGARRPARAAPRAATRAWSRACIVRSPAVFGDDTLTTTKSATSRTASKRAR